MKNNKQNLIGIVQFGGSSRRKADFNGLNREYFDIGHGSRTHFWDCTFKRFLPKLIMIKDKSARAKRCVISSYNFDFIMNFSNTDAFYDNVPSGYYDPEVCKLFSFLWQINFY